MSFRSGVLTGVVLTLLCVGGSWAAWRLVTSGPAEKTKGPPPAPPAVVSKALKEDQINTLTLTPEAIQRLALRTEAVERRSVHRVRMYGGDVTAPPGQAISVASPMAGMLKAPPGGIRQPGQTVKKGQAMFQLLPLLTPEGRVNLTTAKVEAEGQVQSAQCQLEAVQIALDRAKKVLASEAGSRRAVDEAQAQYDLAHKSLEVATARRDLLAKVVGEVKDGTAGPLSIESPSDGLLRTVVAMAGQNVPAGAALFEVLELSRVWVRVPVYVGDLPEINTAAEAAIGDLTADPGQRARMAKPAAAPPSADPTAGTVDLFYQLDNREGTYRPGQRVGVTLALSSQADSLTLPWAAVIHDIHGGTWVYEQVAAGTFVRRRVQVRYVVDGTAVIASGPAEGSKVVSAGAAELFGTETGFTK